MCMFSWIQPAFFWDCAEGSQPFIWCQPFCYNAKTALQWRWKGIFFYSCWLSTLRVASVLIYIQFQLAKHCDANFLLVSKWWISKYWLASERGRKAQNKFPKKDSTNDLENSSQSVLAVDGSSWQCCVSLPSLDLNHLPQCGRTLFGAVGVWVWKVWLLSEGNLVLLAAPNVSWQKETPWFCSIVLHNL